MTEDKIFELAELLADEAFGKKGLIAYSERQELTSKFNDMLVKKLTIPVVIVPKGTVYPHCRGTGKYGHDRCDPPNWYICDNCDGSWRTAL